jgi:hypothetical protein
VAKYVFVLPSPPRLEGQAQGRGETKAKEHREVCKGDDVVVIEDSLDDEDEETLQQQFQLCSRFSRARMPGILVIEKTSSLEASLPAPPRKPRNVAQKCAVKKVKRSEATRSEVSNTTRVVEYCR